ncbi:tudor and KH domain-containing protein homolog isoform X2 [Ceratina calcarata]|uniref:Tudor and KH domain-containing protein homolog isoform X2 n=2 Tax=Ceratina calcarata TaxID=156304 RepID=A0AAJ7IYQ2_9HYME|nr:tudor and KH domain-containing protein homolog isoform X2 [Ceratina calcarata]
MRWISPKFSLPVLLGLSLTSMGIAMLYVLYKKEEEESKSKVFKTQRPNTVEYKVQRQHVPAVIGRAGSTIKAVEDRTRTKIHFNEDNIENPERVCKITGSLEGINLAKSMIKSIIDNQPVIETYEILVPQRACNKIIGRNGETKRQIQASSSAKIILEGSFSHDTNAERRIIIKGTAEQIAAALSQIEEKVREVKAIHTRLEASSASRQPRGKLSPHGSRVNASEQTQASPEISSLQDCTMEVYVCAMDTPSQFWVQVVGSGTTALDKLVSEMSAYYSDEENQQLHTLRNITIGQMVAAKFSFDEQWYRGEIISITEDNRYDVYFVDYGDHELVNFEYVYELRTDFLSLKWQAIECSLANVKPRQSEWSIEACDRFAELAWVAQWRILVAKVRRYKERTVNCRRSRREGSPIPCVDLFDKNEDKEINLGQELINEELAEPEESFLSGASSTLSLSTRSHEITTVSSPTSVSPLPKRGFNSESLVKAERESDSNTESLNTSVTELDNISSSLKVEEINLITPNETVERIEEIDLVTPKKDESSRFIANETKGWAEDGSGDYMRNCDSNRKSGSSQSKPMSCAPGGYEDELTEDSDLELGAAIFRSSTGKSGGADKKRGTKNSTSDGAGGSGNAKRRTKKVRYRKLLHNSNVASFVRRLRCFGRTSLPGDSRRRDRRDRAESSGISQQDHTADRGLRTSASS